MGCSTHKVPSWSKVAIRSSGGTKSGLDLSVVAFTKSMIACFAGPSFHEARVSVANGASATAMTGNKGEDRTANAPNSAIKIRRVIPEAKGFGAMLHLFEYVGGKAALRGVVCTSARSYSPVAITDQESNHEF